MRVSIFGTAGAALNFGIRRLETIARVAWLPVTLLLVANMAFVFAALSIRLERIVTFTDIFGRISFQVATARAQQVFAEGLATGSASMATLGVFTLAVQLILTASFMAPLIRLKGVGETPPPGLVRVAAGPDQWRFIGGQMISVLGVVLLIAPLWLAFMYIGSEVEAALRNLYVGFPDADSLHTVEIREANAVIAERGQTWLFDYGAWYAIAGIGGALTAFVAGAHVRGGGGGLVLSTLFGLAFAGALACAALFAATGGFEQTLASRPAAASTAQAFAFVLLFYAGVRAFPYAGVVVCRRSMAVGEALAVTRGWNFARLLGVFVVFLAALAIAQFALFNIAFPTAASTVAALFQLSEVFSRFSNGGAEASSWVLPLFQSLWTGVKILVHYLWLFFTYGAFAGLFGGLYRASVRAD